MMYYDKVYMTPRRNLTTQTTKSTIKENKPSATKWSTALKNIQIHVYLHGEKKNWLN